MTLSRTASILAILLTCSATWTYSDIVTVAQKELRAPHPLKKSFRKYEPVQEDMIEMVSERVVVRPPETPLERELARGNCILDSLYYFEDDDSSYFSEKDDTHDWGVLTNFLSHAGISDSPYDFSHFKDNFIVDCSFEMKSHADHSIKSHIGFPISGNNGTYESGFDVFANGVRLPVKIWYDKGDYGDYKGFYIWELEWQPHETIMVRCIFGTDTPGKRVPLCSSDILTYIVKTGNYWRGPIGQATIIMDLGINGKKWEQHQSALEHEQHIIRKFTYSHPENAHWTDEHTLEWNFKNWSPINDISASLLAWDPQTNMAWTSFVPWEYAGYATNYAAGFFDIIIDAEMNIARDYFPEQIQPEHRELVKQQHAKWLRNQLLYAHNFEYANFSEYTGFDEVTPKEQNGPSGMFRYCRYPYPKKREYWPNREKTLEDVLGELNDIERANYDFLLEVIAETAEQKEDT